MKRRACPNSMHAAVTLFVLALATLTDTLVATPFVNNGHALSAITLYDRASNLAPIIFVASTTEGILNLNSLEKQRAYSCAENCKLSSTCKAFDTCRDGLCALFDTLSPIRGQKKKSNCALYTLYDNEGECDPDEILNPHNLRVSDGQVLASHNSYRLAERSVPAWNYDMPTIEKQLRVGVRGFEIDVQYDVDQDDLHVLHVLNVDENAHHRLLIDYFLEMRKWSDANIGHFPLFVQIEVMGAFKIPSDDDISAGGCAVSDVSDVLKCFAEKCEGKTFAGAEACLMSSCMAKIVSVPTQCLAVGTCLQTAIGEADPTSVVTAASAYATVDKCTVSTSKSPMSVPVTPDIAQKIKSRLVTIMNRVITPLRLIAPENLINGTWPLLQDARGKFIVALMRGWEPDAPTHYFTEISHVAKADDPADVPAALSTGALVRTRADEPFPAVSYNRRKEAVQSGAHFLSVDRLASRIDPSKDPLTSEQSFWVPGTTTESAVGCNPASPEAPSARRGP